MNTKKVVGPTMPAVTRRPRHLTGTELLDWIALRRVHEGGVTMHGSGHIDHGRKVPCYLPEAFVRLADAELIRVLEADYPAGPRQVVLLPLGEALYQQLNAQHCRSACPRSASKWMVSPH